MKNRNAYRNFIDAQKRGITPEMRESAKRDFPAFWEHAKTAFAKLDQELAAEDATQKERFLQWASQAVATRTDAVRERVLNFLERAWSSLPSPQHKPLALAAAGVAEMAEGFEATAILLSDQGEEEINVFVHSVPTEIDGQRVAIDTIGSEWSLDAKSFPEQLVGRTVVVRIVDPETEERNWFFGEIRDQDMIVVDQNPYHEDLEDLVKKMNCEMPTDYDVNIVVLP